MTSPTASQIDRLTKDIAALRQSEAREAKKEADLLAKINRATDAARRATSASTLQSKARDVERLSKDLAAVGKKRADLAGKIADKAKSLRACEERQQRDEERERKKIADQQRKLIREREAHERWVSSQIRSRASQAQPGTLPLDPARHDFFISHASEDKDGFVRDLADALRSRGTTRPRRMISNIEKLVLAFFGQQKANRVVGVSTRGCHSAICRWPVEGKIRCHPGDCGAQIGSCSLIKCRKAHMRSLAHVDLVDVLRGDTSIND